MRSQNQKFQEGFKHKWADEDLGSSRSTGTAFYAKRSRGKPNKQIRELDAKQRYELAFELWPSRSEDYVYNEKSKTYEYEGEE